MHETHLNNVHGTCYLTADTAGLSSPFCRVTVRASSFRSGSNPQTELLAG
jgi:hypothetical protein